MNDDKPGKEPLLQENKKASKRNKQCMLNIFSPGKSSANQNKELKLQKLN